MASESKNPDLSGLKEFKLHVDTWSTYISRLKAWFVLQDVKPTHFSKFLVAVVGTEPLDLIIDLCYPDTPEEVSFDTIVTLVEDHLSPKRSLMAERMIFRSYKQVDGQSISEYLVQLKKLSKSCKFTDNNSLKENLRDQFVYGLRSERIRQRLLTEDDGITLKRATELALSLEAAVRDSKPAEAGQAASAPGARGEAEPVYAVGGAARPRGGAGARARGSRRARGTHRPPRRGYGDDARGGPSTSGVRCYRCDGRHPQEQCSFLNSVCYVCGDVGHIAKMCRFRRSRDVHRVIGEADDETAEAAPSSDEDPLDVYQVSDAEPDDKWTVKVNINGISIDMEGDTGSAISVISFGTYKKHFSHFELTPYDTSLKMYSGQKVKPRGKFICSAKINNLSIDKLNLVVIDNEFSPSLLGRNWMRAFGIDFPSIDSNDNRVNSVEAKPQSDDICAELMRQFPDVFQAGIGTFNKGQIRLELVEGATAVWRRPRPVPLALRPSVEAELERLQREGIISPVEWSDWGTPVVPVLKKNGAVRLCGDFKTTLNPVLVEDKYPIPRIEDIFAALQGGKFFSKIDLSQAYLQFELDDDSKKLCTIVTLQGMFCYNRLPFGVKCAPNKFQRMMEKLFRMRHVTCYLDDLNVTGVDYEDHYQRLLKVFKILADSGLRVAPEKCKFFQKSVSYLGYIIDADGLHTELSKVDAINNTPVPTSVKELKAFLGLVNYYGKFLRNLSHVLSPLYDLLKKDSEFIWNSACDAAFTAVKARLMSAPVLAHFDGARATSVTCDASPRGVAAVLAQRGADGCERPVLHASRTLSPAEQNYSQICREGLAVIFGVTKFHDYIYGRKFILVTDCKPLASIFSENKGVPLMAASRLQRWAVILGAYNYEVKCIGTEHNCVADSLSRIPVTDDSERSRVDSYVHFVENASPINFKQVAKCTGADEILPRVMSAIKTNWLYCNYEELRPYFSLRQYLSIEQGCLLYGHRVIIPDSLREEILNQLHETHQGIVKCKSLARNYVYWPSIDADIERACRACDACARERPVPAQAPLHPWAWPQEAWYRLHVDFFMLTGNAIYYFVIFDAHSKWIEAFRVPGTTAKSTIAKLRQVFAQFGLPHELVSDNGPPFGSKDFMDFLCSNGIRHIAVTAYKPSSNGAAENAVKIIKLALKKANRENVDLDSALQDFLLIYRSTPHTTTGRSPANLLLGRDLRTPFDLLRPAARDVVQRKQAAQIKYKGGTVREFSTGDPVYFKLYRNNTFSWEKGIVSDRVGPLTYLISSRDKIFKKHVDQLHRDHSNIPDEYADIAIDGYDAQPVPASPVRATPAAGVTAPAPPRTPPEATASPRPDSYNNMSRPIRSRKPPQRFGFEID